MRLVSPRVFANASVRCTQGNTDGARASQRRPPKGDCYDFNCETHILVFAPAVIAFTPHSLQTQ
jgi:hypothetical protein